MNLRPKILLPLLLLTIGAGTFVFLKVTRPEQPSATVEERVWRVDVLEVRPDTLAPSLTLYGRVETPDLLKAAAPGDAVVAEVDVREGQKVSAGQLLVRLDSRDFLPRVDQARADVEELRAQIASERLRHVSDLESLDKEKEILRLARAEAARAERLKRENLGSSSALDQARQSAAQQALQVTAREFSINDHEARLNQLEARLQRAEALLHEAELDYERSVVLAPFDGIVAGVDVASGDRVKRADVMLEMYSLESLEVRARIPAPFQVELQGALAGPHSVRGGRGLGEDRVALELDRLSGEADPSGIDALFAINEGRDWLRMGEMLEFQVERPVRGHVCAVPYQALYGGNRIYVLEDGRLRGLAVEALGSHVNSEGEEQLLIHSDALKPGDRVVVTHLPNAVTGLRVEAIP